VPFHLGKHKPVAPVKRAAFTLKLRLQAAAMGAFVVILGMFRLSHGVISVVNFYAMPVASGAVVAFGCVLLLFSVIPVGWLERTADWLLANHKRKRRFAIAAQVSNLPRAKSGRSWN
jgi:hypothetical protein